MKPVLWVRISQLVDQELHSDLLCLTLSVNALPNQLLKHPPDLQQLIAQLLLGRRILEQIIHIQPHQ